jgi:hypothetical protein
MLLHIGHFTCDALQALQGALYQTLGSMEMMHTTQFMVHNVPSAVRKKRGRFEHMVPTVFHLYCPYGRLAALVLVIEPGRLRYCRCYHAIVLFTINNFKFILFTQKHQNAPTLCWIFTILLVSFVDLLLPLWLFTAQCNMSLILLVHMLTDKECFVSPRSFL